MSSHYLPGRPGAGRLRALLLLIAALAIGHARAQEGPPAAAERNPSRMTLVRDHPQSYVGGEQLEVSVRIDAAQWDGLTAMGLYEQVPAGWTFAGARAGGGAMPGVLPREGASGVLQFVWITQSRAPILLQYTLNIPPDDSGTRSLSGQVEYRLAAGQQMSDVELTQLEGVANEVPVLALLGAVSMTVPHNTSFDDPGAIATDKEDGDITARIETSGLVDTASPGIYTLTYGVIDSAGSRAEPVTRRVRVTAATTAPEAGSPGNGRPEAFVPLRLRDGGALDTSAAREKRMDEARILALDVPDISLGTGRSHRPVTGTDSTPEFPGDGSGGSTPSENALVERHAKLGSQDTAGYAVAPKIAHRNGDPALDGATMRRARFGSALAVAAVLLGAIAIVAWRGARRGTSRRRIR